MFERIYAPLTAGLLRPVAAETRLPDHRLARLDRLYRRVATTLEQLLQAVGLKAA